MSMVPDNLNYGFVKSSARRLLPRLLLGLAVIAVPDAAPAGVFDFLKILRDDDDDVEIIETHHGSHCRCRPRCSHPGPAQKKPATPPAIPQTAYQPTPQNYTTTRPTLPYTPRPTAAAPVTPYPPSVPTLRSAPPAPPVSATLPPPRYATRPTPGVVYQPTRVYQQTPPVIYQREMVVNQVPVTTWQRQWVDQGSYRMVWVSRPTLQQVPRTTYRPVMGYRVVPYQRMTTTATGAPAANLGGNTSAGGQVPPPLEATPVTSKRSDSPVLKPTTAHRVWQARSRFGR